MGAWSIKHCTNWPLKSMVKKGIPGFHWTIQLPEIGIQQSCLHWLHLQQLICLVFLWSLKLLFLNLHCKDNFRLCKNLDELFNYIKILMLIMRYLGSGIKLKISISLKYKLDTSNFKLKKIIYNAFIVVWSNIFFCLEKKIVLIISTWEEKKKW